MRALLCALPFLLAVGCVVPVSQPAQPQPQTNYEQQRARDDQRQRQLAEERRKEQRFQDESEAQKEERLHRQRMEEQREQNRHREAIEGRKGHTRTARSGDADCIGTRRWRTRISNLEIALQHGSRRLCPLSKQVERLLESEREIGCTIPNEQFIEDLITDSHCE